MKNILLCIMLLLTMVGAAYSQDTSAIASKTFYSDSLTTTKDTIDVQFRGDELGLKFYTITCYSTAVDTILVYTLSADGTMWSQHGVKNLASNAAAVAVFSTTTKQEFLIIDAQPKKIRLISTSNDGSVSYFVLAGKSAMAIY